MNNFSYTDKYYMQKALALAKLGEGKTAVNPLVGAVVVKNGKIISSGYHKKYGGEHAEILALKRAGKKAAGADLFLNLEPCSHYGKTPPCVLKIINSGIKRVVISMIDPNPKVAGEGVEILKKAGIKVEIGLLKEKAQKLNEVFLKYIQKNMPFVYLKKAQTLDGYTASKNGDSKWITNSKARLEGHKLRHRVDAIMVGIKTVSADDPSLTARLERQEAVDPLRIVLDPLLEIKTDAQIINQHSKAGTLIITATKTFNLKSKQEKKRLLSSRANIELLDFKAEANYFNLEKILKILAQRKISSLLVEGGAELSYSFLKEDLVDKFYYFIAPKIFGGSDGLASFAGQGPNLISESVELKILEQKNLADNILLIAERKNR